MAIFSFWKGGILLGLICGLITSRLHLLQRRERLVCKGLRRGRLVDTRLLERVGSWEWEETP